MKRGLLVGFILTLTLSLVLAACAKPAPPLNIDLSASSLKVKVGEPVQFTSSVTGGVTPYTYEWDFDSDGKVDSQEANPAHSYSEARTYTVSLKVTDAKGHTKVVTREAYITVTPTLDLEALARNLAEKLKQGDFEAVHKSFNEVMAKALPVDRIKEVWAQVTSQVGDFKRITKTRLTEEAGYKVVYVTCEFAQTSLDLKLAFDKEGKVAGLFFRPPSG